MQVTQVHKSDATDTIATRAREINSTLQKSTEKITASIQATDAAEKKMLDAQNNVQTIEQRYNDTVAIVEQLKKFTDVFSRKIEFSVNKDINRVIVKIIDPATNDTIKVIPSEEIQQIQKRIQDALGLLFDEIV